MVTWEERGEADEFEEEGEVAWREGAEVGVVQWNDGAALDVEV